MVTFATMFDLLFDFPVMLNTSMPIAATATAAGALVRIIMGALLKLLI